VTALLYNPPPYDQELAIRAKLLPTAYDMSALIVVEETPQNKIEIFLETETYEDVQERLVPLSKKSP